MQLNTLIVDDEPLAREGLRMLLVEDPDVAAIREARNGREAIEFIRTAKPDLVFLDVQMPEYDGFAVVREIGAAMPPVVFVTAHDKYAIQAFEINAIDYLLKPVTSDRFAHSLQRVKTRLQTQPAVHAREQILSLLETIAVPQRSLRRLAVRSAGKTVFVDIGDIDWIEAAENYVELHAGRATHLLHVSMNALERSLDASVFARIHRSIIVNIARIKELQAATHGEYLITLDNGVRLQSGRTYNDKVKALAENPF